MRWFWLCLGLLVAACTSLPPVHVSAPYAVDTTRLYLPYASYMPSKKGLALNQNRCDDAVRVGSSWLYDWHTQPPACWFIEAVPMIWSPQYIGQPISQGRYLLGFNECDRIDQCNTSAQDAARSWRLLETTYYNRLLISPAPSSADPEWLWRMREAYIAEYGTPPRFHALAAHCYLASAARCRTLIELFTRWAEEWRIEGGVWVTEFAFSPCMITTMRQAGQLQSWLDSEPGITAYAWFTNRLELTDSGSTGDPACDSVLFNAQGVPTALGQWYANEKN